MTIVEFLLARIAEDEAVAQEAMEGAWLYVDRYGAESVTWQWVRGAGGNRAHERTRHDPARVLAECAAKRLQIKHLIDFMEGDYAPWNEAQLRMMAEVYADHEDFHEEWHRYGEFDS